MFFSNIINKKKSLIKELDSLGYSERVQKVALLARDMDKDKCIKLLYSLLEGGEYEANLALVGADVIRNCEIITKALSHHKNSIRIKAAKLLAKHGSVDEIEKEMRNLSCECRKKLLNTIYYVNRRDVAERLFPIVYSKYGAGEAKRIFAICSDETVEKYIDEIGYAIDHWNRIAVYHEKVFIKYFKKSLEDAKDRERVYVWNTFFDAVEVLVLSNGEFILDCAMNFPPRDKIYSILSKQFGILVRKNPSKVHSILLSEECRKELLLYGVPRCIFSRKVNFTINQWIEIGKILKNKVNHIIKILHSLPPSNREDFFYGVYDEDEVNKKVFHRAILKELPSKLRDKIAKNMLNIKEVLNNKNRYINTLAYCDIEFSRGILEKEAKASNAEERSLALKLIIKSTALSRREVSETLTYLSRIKNDQDPVRKAVLEELSNCQTSLYDDKDVKLLEVIFNSVIEARDTSYDTLNYLGKLAFKILKHNTDKNNSKIFKFALNTLTSLSKRNSILFLFKLDDIEKGLEKIIFEEFYPLLKDLNKRENYSCIIKMANLLGKRGYKIEKLQELLKEVVMSKYENYSKEAAKNYLAYKKTRDKRVKEFLEMDKSFICINEVFLHLHTRRQEWLDPYIEGNVIKGKFLSGETIYLLPAVDKFNKYLPRQQQTFSKLLKIIANGSQYSYYERHQAIHALAKMSDIDLRCFDGLVKSSEVLISESALHALSTTEEPEKAIKVLLDNLDGDKARTAMYSIPRCIRNMNHESFTKVIYELFQREHLKITVRKEVIRLLGEYRSEENIKLLLNEAKKENVHKDVQIAIGHVARKYLDYEFAWEILARLIECKEGDVIKSLLSQYSNHLQKKYRNRYLKLILKIADLDDNEVSKEAIITMKNWINIDENSIANSAYKVITDLNDSGKWKSALDLLICVVVDGNINKYIIDTVRFMVNVRITEDINGKSQRDMPHIQRLNFLANKIVSLNKMTRQKLIPLFEEIIEVIKSDETLKKMSIKLYTACIDFDNSIKTIKYINNIAQILKERPYIMEFSYNEISKVLQNLKGYYNPENLMKSIDEIILQDITEAMYISLSLLETAGNDLLWREDCCEKLRTFRNHKNIEICSKALHIWTSIE
ncbi:HEAT repeat domain-containing protein [Clostridium sp. ZBS2]|uniref:HEAT repeat domain-containing protein n=1 Tax=Clostridium sp. ZBS2 TaxID=2949976 RepID=UPI00207A7140|nr:HEAT repeat domain-containing protein [Clostridium sp. ZBS2]